ncbi:hypothetical protein GRI99_12130, partial [Altererythrobacter buctensis]|nr:hypothetical protein [Alteraurantiacibacter buctensis]
MAGTAKAPARKRAAKPAAEAAAVITYTIPVLIGRPIEEVKAILAERFSGWSDMTANEQDEFAQLAMEQQRRSKPVKTKVVKSENGNTTIDIDGGPAALGLLKLQQAFGATTMEPVNARGAELMKYLKSVGRNDADRYNAALAFLSSMGPRDQAEALLLVQMYCTHDAAMRALSQLGNAEWIPHLQTFGNLAAKLLRTSQGQMETLAKMRRGGVQEVRHTHYYVDNRGGQAVFTDNVTTGGRNP